jgi:hypothetical protein
MPNCSDNLSDISSYFLSADSAIALILHAG